MRKILLMVSVAVLALCLSAGDAFAQRGGRGGGGGGRGGGGRGGGGFGGGGYGRGGGFGRGYGGYGGFGDYGGFGGFGGGLWGWPGYGGYGGGYYPDYDYGYSYPYYDYGPGYYSAAPNYYSGAMAQAPTTTSQSFYADPNAVTISVRVPNADAQVWFDDAATSERGTERTYYTAGLQKAGTYSIKARWNTPSGPVTQERQVRVQPGQSVQVDFRSEAVPSPQPKQ